MPIAEINKKTETIVHLSDIRNQVVRNRSTTWSCAAFNDQALPPTQFEIRIKSTKKAIKSARFDPVIDTFTHYEVLGSQVNGNEVTYILQEKLPSRSIGEVIINAIADWLDVGLREDLDRQIKKLESDLVKEKKVLSDLIERSQSLRVNSRFPTKVNTCWSESQERIYLLTQSRKQYIRLRYFLYNPGGGKNSPYWASTALIDDKFKLSNLLTKEQLMLAIIDMNREIGKTLWSSNKEMDLPIRINWPLIQDDLLDRLALCLKALVTEDPAYLYSACLI